MAALELYRLFVFAYLSGNGDLHAKNPAVLRDRQGEWRVTTAYDLPSSAVYGDRTMALPIGGRIRQQLSWPILRSLSEAIGVPERLASEVIREQATAAEMWIADLSQFPFDANTIRNLRRLVHARIRHIRPEAQQVPSSRPLMPRPLPAVNLRALDHTSNGHKHRPAAVPPRRQQAVLAMRRMS